MSEMHEDAPEDITPPDTVRRLSDVVAGSFGIQMRPRHAVEVHARLCRELAPMGGIAPFLDCVAHRRDADALDRLAREVSTSVTALFREPHHFEALRAHAAGMGHMIAPRFWSAGCASGEEAWSIAATVAPLLPAAARARMLVLATDIDRTALAAGQVARYHPGLMPVAERHAPGGFELRDGALEPAPDLRPSVRFRRLNLVDPLPFAARFDAIFCRNTLIYFSPEMRRTVLGRLISRLREGGLLMLGHSETLLAPPPKLEPVGLTTYRRIA